MQHLSGEALARLLDEEPDEVEVAHLAACEECRAEQEALAEQRAALAALPDLEPPATAWPALEARLAGEGLLRPRRSALRVVLLRAAAVAAIFAAGAGTGAWLRPAVAGPAAVAARVEPRTAREAAERLRGAEAEYITALARYAELSGTAGSVDPVNRLAALEGIVLTTRSALQQAPADPVINGYHLTALGQRDALLRQITRESGDRTWY